MNRGLLNGASYSTLDLVYRGTTVPKNYGRVKKMFRLGWSARKKLEPLFNLSNSSMADVSAEEQIYRKELMDRFGTMNMSREEAAARMGLNDIELRSIQLDPPSSQARRLNAEGGTQTYVHTNHGDLLVVVNGDRSKPAILTMHDLGLNFSGFLPFFNYEEMKALMVNFCVYHVNALGQEANCPSLPENFPYPSMDEQADMLNYVLAHFGLRDFIGFGAGAGANILARYALRFPSKVNALALINCDSHSAGWIEWAYQKMNTRSLRANGMTHGVLDYLMWHHFGRFAQERNPELVLLYRNYFYRHVNPINLSMMINSYVCRPDLNISRDGVTLNVPVLNITGALSPHMEHTVTLNGRLNPNKSTWLKVSDCAMVLEERPSKIAEAFCLFLQGEGYVAPLSPTKLVALRKLSELGQQPKAQPQPQRRPTCRHSPVIRITENPISEAVVC